MNCDLSKVTDKEINEELISNDCCNDLSVHLVALKLITNSTFNCEHEEHVFNTVLSLMNSLGKQFYFSNGRVELFEIRKSLLIESVRNGNSLPVTAKNLGFNVIRAHEMCLEANVKPKRSRKFHKTYDEMLGIIEGFIPSEFLLNY
ncbi:hypothetical protein [Vibrio harveyi]|uniref:hypothetical protein n=1 Tax=Vibrio harveyi TaxID=669 RepID=UPI0025B211A3|nr:hypothetical protein [Vibrio harveyi]WJT10157.1 hypothetical protein PH545_18910 [Vibrio harveyi]